MGENKASQLAKGQTSVPVASTCPDIFQSQRHQLKLGHILHKLIKKLETKPLQISGETPFFFFLKGA